MVNNSAGAAGQGLSGERGRSGTRGRGRKQPDAVLQSAAPAAAALSLSAAPAAVTTAAAAVPLSTAPITAAASSATEVLLSAALQFMLHALEAPRYVTLLRYMHSTFY